MRKTKFLKETTKFHKVLSKFKTHNTTKTNEFLYAGAFVVMNRLRVKIDKVDWRKELMLKRSLQNKINKLRKDLSQLEASKDNILVILDIGKN